MNRASGASRKFVDGIKYLKVMQESRTYNAAFIRMSSEFVLDTKKEILAILDEVLSLKGRSASFSEQTVLLGAIPELDSMAVLALISTLEERFGVVVDDDEIDGATFATVGSLIEFVDQKLAG